MLPDRDALFACVLAHPGDDLPRLVFADYLEESGHPALVARAAYIRTQIDAANASDDDDCLRLTRAAAALKGQFTDEADAVLENTPRFRLFVRRARGFVSDLRGTAADLGAEAGAVFAAAPVTGLHFETFDVEARWVASASYLRHVTHLTICGLEPRLIGWTHLDHVLRNEFLGSIEQLGLSGNSLDDRSLVWLVSRLPGSPVSRSLRALDLSRNVLTDAAASLLTAARGLEAVTALDLRGNRLTPAAVAALRRRFGDRVLV